MERHLVARSQRLSQGHASSCPVTFKPLTCLLLTFTLVFLPDPDPDLAAIGLALVGLVLANLRLTGKVDCTFKNSFAVDSINIYEVFV